MRRLALPLALVVLLAVAGLAAPALSSPQPTPVCGFCGAQFAGAADDAGATVTVVESAVEVRVHEDGSATWTVRNRLANGSAAFGGSDERLAAVGRSLSDDRYGLPETATFVDAGFDGDVAVLRFRDPDAAERHAGLLVVDYLHEGGYEPWFHVNADRFVVRGPPGTVVANDPDSGRVDGDAVAWTGATTAELWDSEPVAGSPYVVFGPDRSAATRTRATAAVALATWPIVRGSLGRFLVLQTAAFAVLLGLVVLAVRRWGPAPPVERLAATVAGIGVLGVLVPAVANGPDWVSGPPVLALGLGALAWHPRSRDWLATPRRQALVVAGLLAATLLVLVGWYAALGRGWPGAALLAVRATAIALPLAALVPLGGALARRPAVPWRWLAVAVGAFALVPALVVDLADPPVGLGSGLLSIALLALAVVAPLVGALGLLLGRSLARRGDADGTPAEPTPLAATP